MSDQSFEPRDFQDCTIRWAAKRLFSKSKKPGVRRFLVADEVGLGKTMIARGVIESLRKSRPRSRLSVVYMTSSLDISAQNRATLVDSAEDVCEADRIVTLFARRPQRAKPGVLVYSMTPGTSISVRRSPGNVEERLYMAWLARKMFGIGARRTHQIFALNAPSRFRQGAHGFRALPGGMGWALRKAWRGIQVDERALSDILRARRAHISRRLARDVVCRMRHELIRVLLAGFEPDLIVLDEFQRFKDLTRLPEFDERIETHHLFLRPQTPTLLLSATPYRPMDDGQAGVLGHLSDLKETFAFLYGSRQRASKAIASIHDYGESLRSLNERSVRPFLKKKLAVEAELKQVMSRTERLAFADRDAQMTSERFLSDSTALAFEKQHLYEFLALAKAGSSRKTLLAYWKSGSKLMSYMDAYQDHRRWRRQPSIKQDPRLFSDAKKGVDHLKLRYVADDVFKRGQNFKYLWIPATRPYYDGHGIFDPAALKRNDPKKGLIFSSWRFVPRQIAAEINEWRHRTLGTISTNNPLRATPVTWAELYFPSRFLAEALTHEDFANAGSLPTLIAKARSRIVLRLRELGIPIQARGDKAWQLIRHIDSRNRGFRDALRSYRDGGMEDRYLAAVRAFTRTPIASRKTVDELARIAVGSPSVCLLRALGAVTDEEWLDVAHFCIRDLKNYINRSSTHRAIYKSGFRGRYANRAQEYFLHGNIQAVLDEFLYLILQRGRDVDRALKSLGGALGAHGGFVQVSSFGAKKRRVSTDVAVLFGEAADQASSRDAVRVGFNSPFWPMVLATTSVGQEGLDFHFYCKDIYHWNMPSTPVHFEQREGRINRYCNLAIRKSLAKQGKPSILKGETLWSALLRESRLHCRRNDRYNLGLSPHWVYTPRDAKDREGFVRHILDLPGSQDRTRYERLKHELNRYRLSLGQPDQKSFLKDLTKNKFLSGIDAWGLILNLFPYEMRRRGDSVRELLSDPNKIRQLVNDAADYLDDLKTHPHHRLLARPVRRHCNHLDQAKRLRRSSVIALHYFVDRHDKNNDRHPAVGFEDDLRVLTAAL